MTTFVTVLRRAVESLEDNNAQERTAIYERARSALEAQLRGLDPPLPEDELDRQIAELDEAIDAVEDEYARMDGPHADEPAPASPDWSATHDIDEPPAEPAEPDPRDRFRSALAETAALGTATSQAARSARDAYDVFGDGDAHATEPVAGHKASYPQDAPHGEPHYHEPADDDRAEEVAAAMAGSEAARYQSAPPSTYEDDYEGGGRGLGLAMWAIVVLMIAGIAGAAYWQRDALTEVVMSLGGGGTEVAESVDEPKIDERVPAVAAGPDDAPEPAAQPETAEPTLPQEAARVAQALLVEEGPENALTSFSGSVDWSLLDDPEAPPEAARVIRGTVQVPDKNMTLTLAIRRNADPDLPASHTVELLFDTPSGFENGGIAGVAGLVMKATPQSQGQPLIGAVVPVTEDFYLLGLSEGEFDLARNLDELRRRNFIDVPIVYADESRAILSIAKGESGAEVFQQAFESWGQ